MGNTHCIKKQHGQRGRAYSSVKAKPEIKLNEKRQSQYKSVRKGEFIKILLREGKEIMK